MSKTNSVRIEPMPNTYLTKKTSESHDRVLVILGLIVVLDQMLLPMFHPFGISFKPSYLILIVAPFIVRNRPRTTEDTGSRQRFWKMTLPIIGIAVFGFLGQLVSTFTLGILESDVVVVRLATLLLMILAFRFGQLVPSFQLRWILWALYALICITLVLSIIPERVPVLMHLWWKTDAVIAERILQNQVRPTPFGDGSMVGTMLLFLFVTVASRLGYLRIPGYHVVLSISLIVITAFVLVSRNQMIAVIILGAALALSGSSHLVRKIAFLVILAAGLTILFVAYEDAARTQFAFVDYAYSRFETADLFDTVNQEKTDSILRPLLRWDMFTDRFLTSPLIGTGFSTGPSYPFMRLNFHNDWFYVWATSGALGGMLLFVWMFQIYKELGLLVLLPFFLPGLTNSFLLHISGVIVYCFMLGVLIERRYLPET